MNKFDNNQLKDITISIACADVDDDGNSYAITKIYRGDLEGSIDDFIKYVEESEQIFQFDAMKSAIN